MVGFSRTAILILFLITLLSSCALHQHGVYHVVEEGQTLFRISKTYSVDENTIARINRINNPTRLQVGTKLFIPGASKVLTIEKPENRTSSSLPRTTPPAVAEESTKAKEKAQGKVHLEKGPTVAAGKGLFSWPVKGSVVRRFGSGDGTFCQGLEIATPALSTVRAAAAGKVIYSGNGIPGYGHLIILGHEKSFFTVYGFNDRNLVKTGSYVGQGDKIALSGTPPGGGNPRIHFEIRHGKQPVDPLFYLP